VAVAPRAIVDHKGSEGTIRAGSEDVRVSYAIPLGRVGK
jgi:hypothetical protein